jgi:hypothetical protein
MDINKGPVTGINIPQPSLAENPLEGTSSAGTGVTGESNTGKGIVGMSLGPPPPAGNIPISGSEILVSTVKNDDGVYGVGNNGVHGVANTATGNGILGETSGTGAGVSGKNTGSGAAIVGTSSASHGVYGTNGAGTGTNPTYGCGVRGESANGYGVYGASLTAAAVMGVGKTAGQFTGAVNVTGDITVSGSITASDVILSGADFAEDFDITVETELEPGSVVVFDEDGTVCQSDIPYNKRVAGVISGAGKYRPGVILNRTGLSREGKVPVALMGRVYCKVDASYAAIEVGDMLTTSPTPGCAMKAADPLQAFGAVIGKALSPMSGGQGLIPILVTLQ